MEWGEDGHVLLRDLLDSELFIFYNLYIYIILKFFLIYLFLSDRVLDLFVDRYCNTIP